MSTTSRSIKPRSVVWHLGLLGLALVIPVLVTLSILFMGSARQDRDRIEAEVRGAAVTLARDFDRELASQIGILGALSVAPSLDAGDFEAFARQARTVGEREGVGYTLRTLEGRQLVNTRVNGGAALPALVFDVDAEAIRSRQPKVTNLYRSPATRRPTFSVVLPVLRDGEARWLLHAAFPAERAASLLSERLPSVAWAASISGRDGIVVGRTRDQERFVGQPITDQLRNAIRGADGIWEGPSHEGVAILGAYARAPLSGWLVAVGVDREVLAAPVQGSLRMLGWLAFALAVLLTSLAFLFGRRLTQPILALAEDAKALGPNGRLTPRPSAISEVQSVSEALAAALERAEDRDLALRLAIDAARMGEADLSLATGLCVRSPRVDEIFGFAPGEAGPEAAELMDRVHPEDVARVRAEATEALARRADFASEFRVAWPNGEVRWVAANGRVVADADGKPERMVAVLRDVTVRRLAEAEIRRSEERLQLGVDVAGLGLAQLDYLADTITLDARTAACFDLPAEEAMPRARVHERFHPDDAPSVRARIEALLSEQDGPGDLAVVHRVLHRSGEVRWLSARKRIQYQTEADGRRRACRGLLAVQDITAVRAAEDALRAAEATLSAVLDALPIGVIIADVNGRILRDNEANRELWGIPPETVSWEDYAEWVGWWPETGERIKAEDWAMARALLKGEVVRNELVENQRFGDGGRRFFLNNAAPVRDGEGRVVAGVVAELDVTELRKADEELRRLNADLERQVEARAREAKDALAQLFETQKLESIGQLTGGVAHDFNNLLAAIIANLELLRKRVADDARLLRLVDGAMQAADRGATLTGRLLAFARRQELKAESVALPDLVEGMRDLIARTIGPEIRIAIDLAADLPQVLVDPNQLELAILNLSVNARDAMPGGGSLIIAAKAERVAGARTGLSLRPGDYVCLSVTDTGAGMDKETLRRAAEPFFTTKGVGKGTGLGLPMVQGLAAQSGGAMRLESRRGKGTTVQIWLPQARDDGQRGPRLASSLPEPAPMEGRWTILTVDDDVLVAMGTTAMLEDLGHEVIEAHSGAEALARLGERADIDLVITDQGMPGMSGVELAAAIRRSHPRLPVILATGYAELPGGDDAGLPRLAKPFRQDALAAAVEAALKGRAAASSKVVPLRR